EHLYVDNLLSSVRWKQRYYGVPWVAGTRVLYYNKEIFDRAGLDPDTPPQTYDDLKKYILQIAARCPDVHPFALPVSEKYSPWQVFLPFLWSYGGHIFDPATSDLVINSETNRTVLQFYKQLSHYSLLARQPQIDRSFAKGTVGMIISGGWNLGLISRLNPQLNFSVSLLPEHNGRSISFAGSEALVIMKNSKYPEEAKKLIEYLTSYEIQMEIVKTVPSFIPSLKKGISDPYFEELPYRKIFLKQLATAYSPPPHPKWSSIQELLSHSIEDVIFNKKNPEKILNKLEHNIRNILATYSPPIMRKFSTRSGLFILFGIGILFFLAIVYRGILLKGKGKINFLRMVHLYLFLLPWLCIFFIFYLFPFIYSFILSLTDYNPLQGNYGFCGISNYITVLKDPDFGKALRNTLYFAFATCPASLGLALICATAIYRRIPLYRFFQASLFTPVCISIIVAAAMFSYFYSSEGIFNTVLNMLNIPIPSPDNWLVNKNLALMAIMIMHIWSTFGLYMIIFSAGLYAIPREHLEASRIDGADTWKRFRYIVLPQLKPFLFLVIILNTIKSFHVFPEVFAMTQGGPNRETLTLVYYLYETGFHKFQMGKASAIGYILLFIIGIFSILELFLLKKGRNS
ncbi:extracellular solute-binding protein, partial [bacterium]|nr:extracellular solute-binding protein [bacterium]